MIEHFDLSSDGISNIHTKNIILNESFITFASRFANEFGTVILLSGKSSFDCGEYNIMGYAPWLYFCGKNRNMSVTVNCKTFEFEANPFDVLQYLLEIYDASNFKTNIPISSGLMGYLAYDLKNSLEKLPVTTIDDSHLPDICFFIPSIIVVNNILDNTTRLFFSSNKNGNIKDQRKVVESFENKLKLDPPMKNNFYVGNKGYKSNLSHGEYIDAVKKIKKYISEGDVYQVNLSQRFESDFKGDGFSFFKALYDTNPASFFAYINAYNHQIISTSPERLVMQRNKNIETRPIKGTCPRGKTSATDKLMKNRLLNSHKDDAELSMIVDLLRNDLGKVCEVDSISVYKHKKLEAYQNVYHLVSIIKGKLDSSKNSIDLIKSIFPGGSITGCPKIRSMEIIDELEANCRHIYTGSLGYISFHETMDLSVAIRTVTIFDNLMRFSVGGGIIYDSNPEEEFNETLHKGETVMKFFDNDPPATSNQKLDVNVSWVWFNGVLKLSNNASFPIDDLGVIYGFGFFETLRVENNYIYFLEEHIERFNRSWIKLFKTPALNLTWDTIIRQVIRANDLVQCVSNVKIIATKGKSDNKVSFNGSILVSAKLYKSRISDSKKGFKVLVYPHSRKTPLAVYKTLNYLYYYLAGLWAADRGFDESIILNPDGTISEGNSSNILLVYNKVITIPKSDFVLKGVMGSAVIEQLRKMQYSVIERSVEESELFKADAIFLTNSLIGIVPIVSVNNKPINFNSEFAKVINNKIFYRIKQ